MFYVHSICQIKLRGIESVDMLLTSSWSRPLGCERVYLPLCDVADISPHMNGVGEIMYVLEAFFRPYHTVQVTRCSSKWLSRPLAHRVSYVPIKRVAHMTLCVLEDVVFYKLKTSILFLQSMGDFQSCGNPDCQYNEIYIPASTRRWSNADLMLVHRLQHWASIGSTYCVCWGML